MGRLCGRVGCHKKVDMNDREAIGIPHVYLRHLAKNDLFLAASYPWIFPQKGAAEMTGICPRESGENAQKMPYIHLFLLEKTGAKNRRNPSENNGEDDSFFEWKTGK